MDSAAGPEGNGAIAIELDFVHPLRTLAQLFGPQQEHGFDERCPADDFHPPQSPSKKRVGFDRDGTSGHVEFVLLRLANDACPAK
jgi:hypothetical protein